MLASKAHSRHPTWPPTVHLLPDSFLAKESTPRSFLTAANKHSYTATLPEITEDEDPFAHFLSPVLEDESTLTPLSDLEDEPSYTAGITPYTSTPNSTKDALFRARLEEKWETFVARRLLQHKPFPAATSSAIPAPLPPPFPQQPLHPTTPPNEDALPDLMDEAMDNDLPSPFSIGPSSPDSMNWYFPSTIDALSSDDDMSDAEEMDLDEEPNLDGWAADRRLLAMQRRVQFSPEMKGRRKFRTTARNASGKKHAWREPSPDLWTVEEEGEEVEDGARGRKGRGRKRVKTVHWNEEVLVLEYER
ncbi:hypothetical protein KVT40_006724 [Elsinoe batatas]|uniref:Uncharacterized protein n=1 Tax=Elsinoe batatas TaxID=2601811 RepID=A0A8K0PF79_9PEZI|nr:hypothetical protein KVT40_006724 [Elsinoe batatas]